MKVQKFKLYESPDNIKLDKEKYGMSFIYFRDSKVAKPFCWKPIFDENGSTTTDEKGIDFDDFWCGEFGQSHSHDCPMLNWENREEGVTYGNLQYKGRLWFEVKGNPVKIISFWDAQNLYVKKELLNQLIDSMKKHTGIDFVKDGWTIDLGTHDDDGLTVTYPLTDFKAPELTDKQKRIIDLEKEFHTAYGKRKEEIRKLLKQLTGVDKNDGEWGSKVYKKKLHDEKGEPVKSISSPGHEMTPAQMNWRYKKEGKVIKFNDFL